MTAGLLIAAPASGTGKTTVMLGLLRAFRDRGLTVQPFKCGPDYIDPAFHRAASGRESLNLDGWAMEGAMLDALSLSARGADLVIAEGSMGLYDGVIAAGAYSNGSSASIARRMGWPVVLVIDASGQAQSAAATALGFATLETGLPFAGVILNRVNSPRHESLLRHAMAQAGITVFGCLPRRADLTLAERHLGLVQAAEHPSLEAAIRDYAAMLAGHVDLDALRGAANASGSKALALGTRMAPPAQRIAVAQDLAFSFLYPHLVQLWRDQGAELVPFSPLADEAPDPASDLVWLPGGYPELHAAKIASAGRFLAGLRTFAQSRPVHGECGGYMVLGRSLTDKDGIRHEMAGLLGLETSFAKRKLNLGYRLATLAAPVGALPTGARLRGHEFHYSSITAQPDPPLARVVDATGTEVAQSGSRRGNVTGSFFHLIAEERP